MPPEGLSTTNLTLRRFGRRDVDALLEGVRTSLRQLNEWLPWAHLGYDKSDAATFVRDTLEAWRAGRAYDYAIRRTEAPKRHLGNVSIWPVSRMTGTGEIGYWVRSDETAKGVATEATAALVRVGFEELGFHRLTLRIAVGNRASERVAEKLGFTREGVLREELLIRGRWTDHTLFALLEHEHGYKREPVA